VRTLGQAFDVVAKGGRDVVRRQSQDKVEVPCRRQIANQVVAQIPGSFGLEVVTGVLRTS